MRVFIKHASKQGGNEINAQRQSQGINHVKYISRSDVNLPQMRQVGRKRRLARLAHPGAVGLMGRLFSEHVLGPAGADSVEKLGGDVDVLGEGGLDVEAGAGDGAEQPGLEEGRVGDGGVGGAAGGEEPGGGGAVEDVGDEVADRVKVRAAEEEARVVGARPRLGLDDEQRHVDVGVERAAALARVEDDAGGGGGQREAVGVRVGGARAEGL